MSRYIARLMSSQARPEGWYVEDAQRSTSHAVVVVGARHHTQIEAQTEARRLEASP